MKQEKVSFRQLMALLWAGLLGPAAEWLPSMVTERAGPAGWLVPLLALPVLLAALLLAAPCAWATSDEDLDEETLAAQQTAAVTPDPAATPVPPEQVYAISDVDNPGEEGETRIEEGTRPDFVEKLLEVARGELGYAEGPHSFTKYGLWSGDANAEWCAEFICWCVDQVDQRYGTNLLDVVYPNYSGQNTGRDWFIERGRFVYRKGNCPDWGYQWLLGSDHLLQKNEYIPRAGDLVFFSYNEAGDTEHVALVEYCTRDAEGNVIIHVIEGNNPSSVQRNSYSLNNSQVLGFGACEDVVGTTMRYGNRGDKVLWLQQALHTLGYLEEKHLTGAFGGNTRRAVMDFQAGMEGKTVNGLADRETQQAIAAALAEMAYNDPNSWLVTD